jgi:nitrogen regulatory protein P-II 2
MKLVIAYIQPEKLDEVKQSLFDKGVTKMSVIDALGCGQQMGYEETYRGVKLEVNLLKKVRLEIAVNDDYLEPTIEGIITGARTGQIGDGKIFVQDLVDVVRIRTGERGEPAIG